MTLNSSNTKIRVTPQILIRRADDAAQRIADVDGRLRNIRRIVDGTRSYWIGSAGNACRKKYESRQEETDRLMRRLREHPRTLLSIAGIYREAEEKAGRISAPLPASIIE